MSLRLKIGWSVVFACIIFNAASQEFHGPTVTLTAKSNTFNAKLSGKQYYFYSLIEGSVYLNDDWTKGAVILQNGDRYDSLFLKLNALDEDLVTYNERTGAVMVIDKFLIDEFILDVNKAAESTFSKLYFDKYPKGEHYYNLLYEGKLKLVRWYHAHEEKTTIYRDIHGLMRDSRYKINSTYFIDFPDNNLVKIKGTRKSLVNLFPEEKKQIRKLLRQNKVNFASKNALELARAVQLIETEFFPD